MRETDTPPVISVIGKKNSGKTTLVVALAAELKRRGYRIATLKHGHHAFEIDQPGRDSWKHFHEGEAEAVLMVGADKVAMVMRWPGSEPNPEALLRHFYGGRGYDLILVEGYKYGPFPKIEVFRRGEHSEPVYDLRDSDAAALFLAVVTDDLNLKVRCPYIPLDRASAQGSHVTAVADLIEMQVLHGGSNAA